tara:strand:- start:132 stop:509 length:378 start_codon:yes stop_codon:yes gene_type:complete
MTTYTYKILNCTRNSSDIVRELEVEWTATKGAINVTHPHWMPLAPAGSSPITYTSIDKSTMESWYDNEIKGKYKVAVGVGSTGMIDDSVTIEERIKEQLDNKIADKEYQIAAESDIPVTKEGLPW